jgi:glutathione S-transferase
MTKLRLFHDWDSFQSQKVRLCLYEKELAWESVIIRLAAFENLSPDYLKINPRGLVPALEVQGVVLTESSAINEYLEEAFQQTPLLPNDLFARARARAWGIYEDTVVHPAVRLATFNMMIKPRLAALSTDEFERLISRHPLPERAAAYRHAATSGIDEAQVLSAIRAFRDILATMDRTLQHHDWLAGRTHSLADVNMMPFIARVSRLGMSELWSPHVALTAWIERMQSRTSHLAHREPNVPLMPVPDAGVIERYLALAG